ncbi:Autophagy-related protein [Trichinella pseudospiralis]
MSVLAQTVLGMSKTVRIHVFTTLWPVGNVKSFQMLCDELELRRCFRPKCMASMAANCDSVFLMKTSIRYTNNFVSSSPNSWFELLPWTFYPPDYALAAGPLG